MHKAGRWGAVWLAGSIGLRAGAEGGVTGTVADESGARLPGVSVEVW